MTEEISDDEEEIVYKKRQVTSPVWHYFYLFASCYLGVFSLLCCHKHYNLCALVTW